MMNDPIYKARMGVNWLNRITVAVELSGLSKADLSKTAGFGVNYVSQMLKDGKMPSVGRLSKLCAVLNIEEGWVFSGAPKNPLLDPVVDLISILPDQLQKAAFSYLTNRSDVSHSELAEISDHAHVSLDQLRHLQVSRAGLPPVFGDSITRLAASELSGVSEPAGEIDHEEFAAALEEAFEIEEAMREKGVLATPASSASRSKMIALLYAKRMARKLAGK